MATTQYHPIVQELIDMIAQNGWQSKFEEALKKAQSYNVIGFEDVKTLDDYFKWVDAQLKWVPVEDRYGKEVFKHVCKFYFILDQSPVKELQNAVMPHDRMQPPTPLSAWMRKFINALGEWMDNPLTLTPESEETFYKSAPYNMDEYERPHGGWKSYNQFFARYTKPGYRPIAAIGDSRVITAPADATFDGQWEVNSNTGVDIKGIYWNIEELLQDSPYASAFKGGQWTHSFLNTTDYHRQHMPVAGTILEARVIQGTVYLQVTAEPIPGDPDGKTQLVGKRVFGAPDDPGYEFMQTRGLFVIDSPIGLVAVLPMGMAQVSSIVPTAEVGRTLHKGEEISYFQFGGSDIVMVFQEKSNVSFTAQPGVHYKVGTRLAIANPVIGRK
ncbi:phosphatidylserine decarboxylase [uncultured Muribaculum sp.]|uniref:phosphatidylserine decarboxylase n=1 Tax=uncultured Muribaculum sp. TaxID=1918613 RepID=UPI0025DEF913|nr:phosphatidylserine decarboxylase [uncultured Muribaculum sp.]